MMQTLSSREKVLVALLNEPAGLSTPDLMARTEYHGREDMFVTLLGGLERNDLIFYSTGCWVHGRYQKPKTAHDGTQQATKKKTSKQKPDSDPAKQKLVDLKSQVVVNYRIKLRTLDRLAEITDPSISEVLEQIQKDLSKVVNTRL